MTGTIDRSELLTLTSKIVTSHLSNNLVGISELQGLIEGVCAALSGAGEPEPAEQRPEAAVSIRRSITPDYLICLEDGKKLKMLKRHIMTRYNLTPEQYRERWGLAPDYPMVAPNYAEQRRELAIKIGLGTKRKRKRRR